MRWHSSPAEEEEEELHHQPASNKAVQMCQGSMYPGLDVLETYHSLSESGMVLKESRTNLKYNKTPPRNLFQIGQRETDRNNCEAS